MRWSLALVALLALLALLVPAAQAPARSTVARADLKRHLKAIHAIARANGGNRASGTNGERTTGNYAARRLARAGWTISRTPVSFPYWAERRRSVLGAYRYGRDYVTMLYSGRGDVTARVVPVGGGGCSSGAYEGFPRGQIAALTASGCGYRDASVLAEQAGARAIIIADHGDGPPSQATLAKPAVGVPVVRVRLPVARRLAGRGSHIRVAVDAVVGRRVTHNVIAELPGSDPGRVVMAGAHMDSVPRGPGMSDNGSGVAALIEAGRHLARQPRRSTLRLAFWSGHEAGMYGSNRYVADLPAEERRRIAVYLNVDMVGSPNGVPELYFNRPELGTVLRRHLAGAGYRSQAAMGGDHDPFRRAGIAIGGIHTGSVEEKTRAQARRWGGRAGRARDGCYHAACDDLSNVNLKLLGVTATAATNALQELAR